VLPLSIAATTKGVLKMELIKFGVDTVRVAFTADQALPIHDPSFQMELAGNSWGVQSRLIPGEDGGPVVESHTAMYQDTENPTLRAGVQNAGRTVWAEMSIPRMLTGSVLNTELGTAADVFDVVEAVRSRLVAGLLPEFRSTDPARFRRIDSAADIGAGANYPGLIAAGAHFKLPRARKVTRTVYPGETARVSGAQMTCRTYDKVREMTDKTAEILAGLSREERESVSAKLEQYRAAGVARLELAQTPKVGISVEDIEHANIKWAEVVESGFGMAGNEGVLFIGGLQRIRQQVDGMDLHAATRSSLLAFAVRYAELGESGMLAAYSRATFFRHKRKFQDLGLALDDVVGFHGELDFRPVLKAVRHG
jgi:hypothetical protein